MAVGFNGHSHFFCQQLADFVYTEGVIIAEGISIPEPVCPVLLSYRGKLEEEISICS